jgi:hypothetical protein
LFLLLPQLLGIAGYEALLRAPTEALADKLLQLIGQKYSVNTSKAHLQNEVMLTVSDNTILLYFNSPQLSIFHLYLQFHAGFK